MVEERELIVPRAGRVMSVSEFAQSKGARIPPPTTPAVATDASDEPVTLEQAALTLHQHLQGKEGFLHVCATYGVNGKGLSVVVSASSVRVPKVWKGWKVKKVVKQ